LRGRRRGLRERGGWSQHDCECEKKRAHGSPVRRSSEDWNLASPSQEEERDSSFRWN